MVEVAHTCLVREEELDGSKMPRAKRVQRWVVVFHARPLPVPNNEAGSDEVQLVSVVGVAANSFSNAFSEEEDSFVTSQVIVKLLESAFVCWVARVTRCAGVFERYPAKASFFSFDPFSRSILICNKNIFSISYSIHFL